jgi:hypothetical protein
MTLSFFGTLVLVTLGAVLAAHTLVRWARRKADAGEIATALAVAAGMVAVGLALQAEGALAAGLQFSGLVLIMVALLALIRRHSRSLS